MFLFGRKNVTIQPQKNFLIGVLVLAALYCGSAAAQWTWTPQTGRFINIKYMPKETPELQVEHARSLMLKNRYKDAMRETNRFFRVYGDTDFADENQFLRGEIRMRQGKYVDAAKEFQRLLAEYPDSDLFDEAIALQYEIGDSLYEKGIKRQNRWWISLSKRPLKKAIQVYSMVIENQPFTLEAAEAQYKLGLCHYARKEYLEAAFEYRRVIEDYSSSEWVKDACHGLAMSYYKASLPRDYDQTPSELAVRAIDDFFARYPADERVGELQEVRREMRERIAQQRLKVTQFHVKRREFDSARIYHGLLVDQYADTEASARAAKWLQENPVVETDARREISDLRRRNIP